MTSERQAWKSRLNIGYIKEYITKPMSKKRILNIVKILAGLTLLILAVKGIEWENLSGEIKSANLVWLVMAIASVILGLFLKLWRWAIFIRNYQIKSSFSKLYSSYFLGQAANIILPLRGGEIVRIGYFAGEPKILPEVASTVVLEKYLDLVALAVCSILVSLKFSLDNIMNLRGLLLPLTGILSLLLFLAIFFGNSTWEKIRASKLLSKRMIDGLDRWVMTSQWLKKPGQVIPGVILTIIIWCVMWATNLFVFKSLGIPLGGTAAGLVLISVFIGLLPALMPGNIGPFYFFASLALVPFGINHDQAFAYAVVLHAIVTLPPLLGGATGLVMHSDRAIAS